MRFIVHAHGSPVTLTLEDKQSISHHTGGATEEGYHRESTTWERHGETLHLTVDASGRDCDGGYGSYQEMECSREKLKGWTCPDGTRVPYWEEVRSSQRDDFAEAAGY